MECYRLSFTAPFHVDSRGNSFYEESESFIHSDTLSAAILSAWALLDPLDAEERAINPPFILSSGFPFYNQSYFLPRAVSTNNAKNDLQNAKKMKKIQWLEISLWHKSLISPEWVNCVDLQQGILQGSLAFEKSQHRQATEEKLWAEEERPRLAIDRATNSAINGQLFNFNRIWFNPNGGLYFLAKFPDLKKQHGFEAALELLSDSGIGADRSNGNGFFNWQKVQNPGLNWAEPHDKAVTLSLVNPAPSDYRSSWLDNAAYKLISRGGWIGQSGLRKKRLRMFSEGSVFNQPLQGQVVDITPEGFALNRVYRDGRGFFVKAG